MATKEVRRQGTHIIYECTPDDLRALANRPGWQWYPGQYSGTRQKYPFERGRIFEKAEDEFRKSGVKMEHIYCCPEG